ncbi:MAG: UPF0158 family protein [Bacteroidetes bacterium]|nr:UPF0158 family protein [Bacteroidota bacterium]
MEMNLTDDEIKSIAEDLDCGMKVYINKVTNKIKSIINTNDLFYADDEFLYEDLKEIEENFDQYFEFEKMDSSESFRVMEYFVESIEDIELKKKLELGLDLSKPFRNFKDIIDSETEYREKWFQFKNEKYIEYVKEQIEYIVH